MIKRQLRSEDFGSYRLVKNELVRKVVKIGEIPLTAQRTSGSLQ